MHLPLFNPILAPKVCPCLYTPERPLHQAGRVIRKVEHQSLPAATNTLFQVLWAKTSMTSVCLLTCRWMQVSFEPHFLQRSPVEGKDWAALIAAVETLQIRVCALESLLEGRSQHLRSAYFQKYFGVDMLPSFRLIHALIAIACAKLGRAVLCHSKKQEVPPICHHVLPCACMPSAQSASMQSRFCSWQPDRSYAASHFHSLVWSPCRTQVSRRSGCCGSRI